jgi:type IV secretory pathway protease TraF
LVARRGGGQTKLVLTAFAAAIALASIITTAVVVVANAATAALQQWLVVVLSTPLSAARSVICRFCQCAIVNTFAAGRRPLSPTFANRCSIALVPTIHHLRHSRQWLVVALSARPAAYQLNHQAENVFMFPHLDLLRLT